MGGGGGGSQVSRVEPWDATQASLQRGILGVNRAFSPREPGLNGAPAYKPGDLRVDPFTGDRVANFEPTQMRAFDTANRAISANMPATQAGSATLTDMMSGGNNPYIMQAANAAMDQAIPAAVSQFSGSGMTDSSVAMDHVGRAAVDAVAPYQFGAAESAQERAMRASALAPSLDQAMYLPAQMGLQFGDRLQFQKQREIDAQRQLFAEREGLPLQELTNYMGLLTGTAGLGQTSIEPNNSPSTASSAIGGGLSGAAAGATIGGPWGAAVGGGLGTLAAFL